MRAKHLIVFILGATSPLACGEKSDDSKKAEPESVLSVDKIAFDVDGDRLLSTLSDSEVRKACETMETILKGADEAVACQIVAAGETDSKSSCEAKRDTCLDAPSSALDKTKISTLPAPLDCTKFEASLTESCEFPVSLLEDCANALAQSVVPSAEAVACSKAADFADFAEANSVATGEKGFEFVSVCADLFSCSALVNTLIGGSGAGGAGGSSN